MNNKVSRAQKYTARLLRELNDIKRPIKVAARESKIPNLHKILSQKEPNLTHKEMSNISKKISSIYPIPFSDLNRDEEDSKNGIKIDSVCQDDGLVVKRNNSDYYRYRDLTMSKFAPFRPEYIEMLQSVETDNPLDPDVVYNRGHFLSQVTMFFGPVNFYYEINGKKMVQEMNTGDTNFISPFVPHSFTKRDKTKEAFIVAVTFGGRAKRALIDLERIPVNLNTLVKSKKDPVSFRKSRIERYLQNEMITEDEFVKSCIANDISVTRAFKILNGGQPTNKEVNKISQIVKTNADALKLIPFNTQNIVCVQKYSPSDYRNWGKNMRIVPLSRNEHHDNVKTFMILLDGSSHSHNIQANLHTFLYNSGEGGEITVTNLNEGEEFILKPRQSAYISPMISFKFSNNQKKEQSVFMVRVPSSVDEECIDELGTFHSIDRIRNENGEWF